MCQSQQFVTWDAGFCHMELSHGRSKFVLLTWIEARFADVVETSSCSGELQESIENFARTIWNCCGLRELIENFERTYTIWNCCGLFFKVSDVILNTDYCCGRLNLRVNHFHFLKEPFDMFRFAITELKYGAVYVRKTAKFSKCSSADASFISKRNRQNDCSTS